MRQVNGLVRPVLIMFGLAAVLSGVLSAGPADAQVNVLSNRYDNNRSAANLNETTLTTSNVNANSFGKLGQYTVDGVIFAQPLYVHGLNLGAAGTHNVLYVATMRDVVYAFDADTFGVAPLWTHDYRNASVSADPNLGDPADGVGTPPIGESFGITSTPVIDLPNNHLFVVTETLQGGNEQFILHMLDIRTGAELITQYIYNSGGYLTQRPGLALANGQIYIGFGSKAPGDFILPDHGYLLTYNATTLAQTGYFQTTGSANGGGLWQSGGAPAIDAAGNVYYLSGNGFDGSYNGADNFQESLLQFSFNGSLGLSNWFTPTNWAYLDSLDLDLSVSSPTLLAGTDLVVFGSKTADVYLLHTSNLGKQTPGDPQLLQKIHVGAVTQITNSNRDRVNSMVYWPRSSNPQLYAWPTLDYLYSYTLSGNSFVANGTGTLAATGMPGAAMSLSANGSKSGSGILWAAVTAFQAADSVGFQGILHAYNAENVAQELWNSGTNPLDSMGAVAKFVPPVVANGKVYVATSEGAVNVYGLRAPETWTKCSSEYGVCVLSGSNTVRFGSGTNFFYQHVIGPVACNTGVFGDPLVGVTKECDYRPETWTTCSAEYGSCTLNGSNTVRFGQFSTYISKSFVGVNTTFACSDAVFTDPLVGVVKQCQFLPQNWETCSQEGGGCVVQGTQSVRYGAYGVYNTQSFSTAVAPCTTAQFGNPVAAGVTPVCQILLY